MVTKKILMIISLIALILFSGCDSRDSHIEPIDINTSIYENSKIATNFYELVFLNCDNTYSVLEYNSSSLRIIPNLEQINCSLSNKTVCILIEYSFDKTALCNQT